MESMLAMITEVIGAVGFPIAVVIAMGCFIWIIYKQSVKREETLMQEIIANRLVNEKAIETIAQYAERLTHIEGSVERIESEVIQIKEKVQ